MKRGAGFWSRLSRAERSSLVHLERGAKGTHNDGYLPDDCSECGACSQPMVGTGLCPPCSTALGRLIAKAEGGAS